MKFNEFKEVYRESKILIKSNENINKSNNLLSHDALFHLPFISLAIIIIAKKRAHTHVKYLPAILGECMESTLDGLANTKYSLSWSSNFRVRSVRALDFLESANLVLVDKNNRLCITPLGKKVCKKAMKEDNDLKIALLRIDRTFDFAYAEKKVREGLL